MKKRKYVIWIIALIMIAVLIPILLDHLVFGNTVPSFLSNGEWAGFLGSYIGGVCTLITLIATIQHYRSADEKKEKAEVQPFLHVFVVGSSAAASTGFLLPGNTEKDIKDLQQVSVTIKNIGNGFANILVMHTGANLGD